MFKKYAGRAIMNVYDMNDNDYILCKLVLSIIWKRRAMVLVRSNDKHFNFFLNRQIIFCHMLIFIS